MANDLTAEQFAARLKSAQTLVGKLIRGRFIKRVFRQSSSALLQDLSKLRNPDAIEMEIDGTPLKAVIRVGNLHGPMPIDRLFRAQRLTQEDFLEAEALKIWHTDEKSQVFTIEASEREPLLKKYRALIGLEGKKGVITAKVQVATNHGFLFEMEPGAIGFLRGNSGVTRNLKAGQMLGVRVKEIGADGLLVLAPKDA
ncbi:MAG TPA: hypothetical protein V6D22_06195 [Candidatus Obscuribacterales bacterium]